MRRNKQRRSRCPGCRMLPELCICGSAPRLELETRVAVIMHVSELKRPSNTGRLVPLSLTNSFMCLRGQKEKPTETAGMVPPGSQGLVLAASDDSSELNQAFLDHIHKPVTLIALDGNWNQAAAMSKREPSLAGLPRVRLPEGPGSNFRLRTQPDPSRVSTFEAIARALGLIEGDAVQEKLEAFFNIMVERMLWARGKLAKEEVAGGVPSAGVISQN